MDITAIITSWKRFDHLEDILSFWSKEVDEVILWDNSGSFSTSLPVKVINSQFNFNPSVRYMLASIAKNDWIINCDDDVLPLPGLIDDFKKQADIDSFLGLEGVNFTGDSYFSQQRILARDIVEPQEVDLVIGYLSLIHRKHLLKFQYSNFSKYQLEMNLQMLLKKSVKRVVVPSSNYKELSCSKDDHALHLDDDGKFDKEEMYNKMFGDNRWI